MTLLSERLNSLNLARKFLFSLLNPKETPKVPKKVRLQAARILKHFPGEYDLKKGGIANES